MKIIIINLILLIFGYIISRFTLLQGSPGKKSNTNNNYEVLWSPLRFPRYVWIVAFLASLIPIVNLFTAGAYFTFNIIFFSYHFNEESDLDLINRFDGEKWDDCIISRWEWKSKFKLWKNKLKPIINFLKEDL